MSRVGLADLMTFLVLIGCFFWCLTLWGRAWLTPRPLGFIDLPLWTRTVLFVLLPAGLTLPELPSCDSGFDSSSWRRTSRAIELETDKDNVSIDGQLITFCVQFSIVVLLLSELLALSTRFMNSSRDGSFSCSSAFSWSTDGTSRTVSQPVQSASCSDKTCT